MTSEIKTVLSIVVITILIIIGGLALTKGGGASVDYAIDPSKLVSDYSPRTGAENAKVQIVEFGDFACPACAMLDPNLKEAVAAYPNDAELVFRVIPIHGETSVYSATAAYAAGEQGKFFDMGSKLFAEQANWSTKKTDEQRTLFISYATALGLDIAKFTADLDSSDFKSEVKKMVTDDNIVATQMKVGSTPTLIINGKTPIVGVQSAATLKQYIEAELVAAGSTTTFGGNTSTSSTSTVPAN